MIDVGATRSRLWRFPRRDRDVTCCHVVTLSEGIDRLLTARGPCAIPAMDRRVGKMDAPIRVGGQMRTRAVARHAPALDDLRLTRSRSLTAGMPPAFLIPIRSDGDERSSSWTRARLAKAIQSAKIRPFADTWQECTGQRPAQLVVDSQLITYAHLAQLQARGIALLTPHRRSSKIVEQPLAHRPTEQRRPPLPHHAHSGQIDRISYDYPQPIRQIGLRGATNQPVCGQATRTRLSCSAERPSKRNLVGKVTELALGYLCAVYNMC